MASIIEIAGVGKQYQLGKRRGMKSVRERLASMLGSKEAGGEEFWALRDVSFSVEPGETVGIVGRNGAGKSTLLKLLSRITAPTTGEIRLRGRVASLLEVGTGFHSELTGRENIFLNGAIMGMTKAEVRSRFDEIVAFSEVEKFIDTPVKRYSSGMYVRLAFAVAAHLTPEILIVDEVLAVGDASFQKKCLGQMQAAASSGRTVLFVSHNLAAVSRLCTRGVLLQAGRVVADGPTSKVIATYSGGVSGESASEIDYTQRERQPGNEHLRLLAARLITDQPGSNELDVRHPLVIEIEYELLTGKYPINPNLHVFNEEGTCVFITGDGYQAEAQQARAAGRYSARVTIPGNFFAEGLFSLDVALSTLDPVIVHAHERSVFTFMVRDPGEGDSTRGLYAGPIPGVVRPMFPWRTERTGS